MKPETEILCLPKEGLK